MKPLRNGWDYAEKRLRESYAAGNIELDEFERRIERILKQDPLGIDAYWATEGMRTEMMLDAYSRGATVFGD